MTQLALSAIGRDRPGIVAAGKRRIHRQRAAARLFWKVSDNRVDRRIHSLRLLQVRVHDLKRGQFTRTNAPDQFVCGQKTNLFACHGGFDAGWPRKKGSW